MGRTFASKKTKASVLSLLSPRLSALGYREHQQEPSTMRTEFRRSMNSDVSVGLQLEFFDGPLAGANITRLRGTFGVASSKLLAIYFRLHNEQRNADFLPIGGSLAAFAPSGSDGSWFFELPQRTEEAAHLIEAVRGPLEQLLIEYDSADKQVANLLGGSRDGVNWNDCFFEPVAHIYLGQFAAAKSAAQKVLASARTSEFAAAYRPFYERVHAEA
jgi:hypothetical protein